MGRNKSFDEETALSAAMHTFRERGYEATSIKHLERATGLQPGSLYHCYGNKEALFRAALDHYNEAIVGTRIAAYLDSAEGVDGIEAMFISALHEPDGRTLGCLLTNSAVEFGTAGSSLADGVDTGFSLLETAETAFYSHVERAQGLGLMSKETSATAAAAKILLLYQGLLVLVRSGRDKDELAILIKDLLAPFRNGGVNV